MRNGAFYPGEFFLGWFLAWGASSFCALMGLWCESESESEKGAWDRNGRGQVWRKGNRRLVNGISYSEPLLEIEMPIYMCTGRTCT